MEDSIEHWSIDLHVHTPASTCYSVLGTTPEQIVEAALAAGLDAIAVTDHNTAVAVERVRQIGSQRGLIVFPGMELSTQWGHVLGLFEPDTEISRINNMIGQFGIRNGGWGDATVIAGAGMEEILRTIIDAGGLAIPAHIDRWPSGLLHASVSLKDRMRLLSSEYIKAVEITVPANRRLWNSGQVPNYPKKLACVQSSDAHAPGEIGRRRVEVKTEKISLANLQEALSGFENKLLFPG
jgi:PHP family Zn ribbon phosphoesterase